MTRSMTGATAMAAGRGLRRALGVLPPRGAIMGIAWAIALIVALAGRTPAPSSPGRPEGMAAIHR